MVIRTRGKFHSHPDAHWHASVVDDMQGRHLLVLFPEYEKQLKKAKTIQPLLIILYEFK